jgi:hypothetical protein
MCETALRSSSSRAGCTLSQCTRQDQFHLSDVGQCRELFYGDSTGDEVAFFTRDIESC